MRPFALLVALPLLAEDRVSYSRQIRPLLAERCQVCHQPANRSGGVSVAAFADVAKAAPKLVAAIDGPAPRMPKAGGPLTAEQVSLIRRWIEQGARDDSAPGDGKETWWSLRALPARADAASSIDGFVRARLTKESIEPSPEADRRTLIRRLTYDLHGLPPTPAEIDAFVSDTAPRSYERLVDRLLESPRYGERWARHWLDVAHYGDSHGYDKDKPRANAWPYRDWVIRALNNDKPYARFVSEQLAGDILNPDDPQATVATGFLAAGPWDFVGHQELREGTTDKNLTRLLDRDDMVAATISTFTSMTVHCARCHDHKFDPIPQADYYSVQAVFAGIDRADRPFDADPALHRRRAGILARRRALQIELQPLLDKAEFATSPQIVELSDRISDARALITHMGEPKTPAEAEEKKRLQARVDRDTAARKAAIDALVGAETYAAIDRLKAQAKAIDDELAALPKPQLVYAAANYFERAGNFRPSLEPRPVHVLMRGNVGSPGAVAHPGALSCVSALKPRFGDTAVEGERRAALARWIVDPANVLTWRSIVNRVWHYHFGSGIVDSPNDFGRMGSKPTHPELLDWLAVWFRDDAGGSPKKLHRLIVTSATYRQSSANRANAAKIDADNRLLWRMNRTRLDAESVRDSVLSVAGKLDLTMGGPGVQMFWFKNDHSPIYDYARFDPDGEGAHRRSIYRFIVRSVTDPFMDRLDCPDPSLLAPKRSTTLTAIQALALWNNPFMLRMSQHLAARLEGSDSDRVTAAARLAWGREPSSEEAAAFRAYAAQHGWANFARLLFNTNEFLFVD
ncbi:MAG: DUF1549 and DUF1553 domain-containing protein [Bryobacteraceae bacterium]